MTRTPTAHVTSRHVIWRHALKKPATWREMRAAVAVYAQLVISSTASLTCVEGTPATAITEYHPQEQRKTNGLRAYKIKTWFFSFLSFTLRLWTRFVGLPNHRLVNYHTEKRGLVTATKLGATNEFFVASTKHFAAATKRFVDRTKHFIVVTKYFCYPYFNKWLCWYNKTSFSVHPRSFCSAFAWF